MKDRNMASALPAPLLATKFGMRSKFSFYVWTPLLAFATVTKLLVGCRLPNRSCEGSSPRLFRTLMRLGTASQMVGAHPLREAPRTNILICNLLSRRRDLT